MRNYISQESNKAESVWGLLHPWETQWRHAAKSNEYNNRNHPDERLGAWRLREPTGEGDCPSRRGVCSRKRAFLLS